MSEERRVIKVYDPRLQVPTETLGVGDVEYGIYCLPRAGVDMVLRITRYLTREVTYRDEWISDFLFYGPTDAQMVRAVDIVGELESGLMSECDLTDITTALQGIEACVCAMQAAQASGSMDTLSASAREYSPDIAESIVIAGQGVPTTDADLCDLANVCWDFQKQWITETVLPFVGSAADAVTIAIGATSGFAILTGGLGLPVAMGTALLGVITNVLIDTSVENLVNWMVSNGQEMVCHLYNGFKQGGYQVAALLAKNHIDNSGLPLGDRMMLNVSLSQTFYLQSMHKLIDDGTLDPLDYDNYTCGACELFDFTYYYDGVGCPAGGLVGSDCSAGVPIVDVDDTAETDNPPLIVNIPAGSTYTIYVNSKNRDAIGGTFTLALKRGDNNLTVESQELVIPATGPRVTYELEYSAYPLTGTYLHISAVGASAAVFYWVGVVVT